MKDPFKFSWPFGHFMLMVLMLLFARTAFGQGTAWADGITKRTTDPCTSSVSNCKRFTFENIPVNTQGTITYGHSYFINFGDGHHECGAVLPGQTTLVVEHGYDALNGHKEIYLQLAQHYEEKDKPARIQVPPGSGSVGGNIAGNIGTLDLHNSLQPRVGDRISFVLSYGNPCTDPAGNGTISGTVNFTPPPQAKVVAIHRFAGEGHQSDPITREEIFSFTGLLQNEHRNLILELKFDSTFKANDQLKFEASLVPPTDPAPPACFSDTVTQIFILSAVKSHDPNRMLADKPYLCPGKLPDSITYDIIFQNIGTGPASMVRVSTFLPDCFDINSIRMLKPALSPTINPTTRELVWTLTTTAATLKDTPNGHELKGINENDPTNLIDEDDTIDTIQFKVKFKPGYQPQPCGAIVARAEVFFDNHPSIFTNDCIIEIRCDSTSCHKTCEGSSEAEDLPMVIYCGTGTVMPDVPDLAPGYRFEWYPTIGVSDPFAAKPSIKPDKSRTYTMVATKDCHRRVFRFRVEMADCQNSKGCGGWWCRWRLCLLALLLALLALFICWRKRRFEDC